MKIEIKEKDNKINYKILASGTLVKFGDKDENIYGYGIYLTDCDSANPIIYDLLDKCYYSDVWSYDIVEVFDNAKMTLEVGDE